MCCFKLISHFKGLLHDQRGWRLLSKWKWTFWECFVMIVTTEKKRLAGWRGTGNQVKAGFFFLVGLCKTKTRLERGISSHSLVCLIRKNLKCNWNSNGMESISNGSKVCFSIIELNFGLSSRFSVWPWVFVEQWPSFRSRDAAWPHLGAVACGCQHLGGIWSTPTCPARVRVASLSPIFLLLKCNTFSSSKGKIYPACWTGSWEKWKKSLRLFAVDLLELRWPSGKLWHFALYFKNSHRSGDCFSWLISRWSVEIPGRKKEKIQMLSGVVRVFVYLLW